MTIEILTILVSFQVFQERVLKLNLVPTVLTCGLYIQQLLAMYEDRLELSGESEQSKLAPDIT